MGCDVHVFAEVKIGGEWHHYGEVRIDRNYALFEKMAGVRGDEREAIVPPRGVPGDATFMTRIHETRWGVDAHTKSWFNAEEIALIGEWYRRKYNTGYAPWENSYLFGNGFEYFNRYPRDYPRELEDIRFIFWFDN